MYRIDAWIIRHVYQALVDWSQRKPSWWCRQCAAAFMAICAARYFAGMSSAPAWGTAAVLLTWASAWAFVGEPYVLAVIGSFSWIRWLLLFLGVMTFAVTLNVPGMLGDAAVVSFYFFAACKPPKPREPRRWLAPAGAS